MEVILSMFLCHPWTNDHILSFDEKNITKSGKFFESQIIEMLSLKMN